MSHQTGIKSNEELKKFFEQAKESVNARSLAVNSRELNRKQASLEK